MIPPTRLADTPLNSQLYAAEKGATALKTQTSKSTTKWPRQSGPGNPTKPASIHHLRTQDAVIHRG
jgi:hypothetical protein